MIIPETLIVDGHYFLHRSLRQPDVMAFKTSTGITTGGVYGFITSLRVALDAYQSIRRVVVAWDTGRSPRREGILPEYKGQREPKNEEEAAEQEKFHKTFNEQIQLLKQNLFYMGVRQVALPCREGDDLIGTICDLYPDEAKIVVTEDKDMLQLVDATTSVFRPRKEDEVNAGNFLEKTGAANRDLFLVSKAIVGDVSDNILGVPKAGPTTVKQLLEVANEAVEEVVEDPVTAFMLACESQPKTKKGAMLARVRAVYEGRDTILRNLEMMDIRKEEFSDEEKEAIRYYVKGGRMKYDREKVMKFFIDLEFKSMLKYFSSYDRLFGELR